MKTNKAPEKIYLTENPITEEPDYMWFSQRTCDNDVEYTRTDAFIDKACKWLERNFNMPNDFECHFRKAMKGE